MPGSFALGAWPEDPCSTMAFYLESSLSKDVAQVKALVLGGKDEGAPGPRGDSGFYGAYFRDLDGNKLAVFCMA